MAKSLQSTLRRDESHAAGNSESSVHIRFRIPDIDQQTLMVFSQDDTVWTAKQRLLETVGKALKDGMNYGLYCPPCNGRSGKFLDEERPLRDYPLPGPIGYLEFLPKRRLYKAPEPSATKRKKMNSSSNQKKFMEYVAKGDADKITTALNSLLDPNFTVSDKSGESPLTLSATLQRPRMIMLALVGGGAFIDYRNKKGFTAMHVAAQAGNRDALRALLDLGGSPNYKDAQGLTPLYHCVLNDTNPQCVVMLLHERAELDVRDERGWTELHQACKLGRVPHLTHLMFYGGDMNAQTEGGDTPLHICARYREEECARLLLYRGADKTLLNVHGHDAATVAQTCGHNHLCDMISGFRKDEIVLFTELPQYNDKRRGTISIATIRNLQRSRSNPNLSDIFQQDASYTASLSSAHGYQYLSNGFLNNNSTVNRDISDTVSNKSSASLKWKHDTRMVSVRKDDNGYGFVIRGARSRPGLESTTLNFRPTPEIPALQYFDQIQSGSAADLAGLRAGDFILEINGESVMRATHEHTVQLIRQSVRTLRLKVVTVTSLAESTSQSGSAASIGSLSPSPKKQAPAPPLLDQQKSISGSIGSKTVTSYNSWKAIEQLDETLARYDIDTSSNSDTTSLRYAGFNNGGLTVSKDVTNTMVPASNPATTVYVTTAELHQEPKIDHQEGFRTRSDVVLNSHDIEGGSGDELPPEPDPDYEEDDDRFDNKFIVVTTADGGTALKEWDGKFPPPPIQSTSEPISSATVSEKRDTLSPPPPPPPPPPPASTPSQFSSIRSTTSSMSRPQLEILEEARRQEDAHAAILAAVARRRDRLENGDGYSVNGSEREASSSTVANVADRNKEIKLSVGHVADSAKETKTSSGEPTDSVKSEGDDRLSSNGDMGYMAAAEKARQEYLLKQSTLRSAKAGAKDPSRVSVMASGDLAQIVAQKALERQNNAFGKGSEQNGVTTNGGSVNGSEKQSDSAIKTDDNRLSTVGNSRIYSGKVQPKIMSPQGKENGVAKPPEILAKSNNVAITGNSGTLIRSGNTGVKVKPNGTAFNGNGKIESLPNKTVATTNGIVKSTSGNTIAFNQVNQVKRVENDVNRISYNPANHVKRVDDDVNKTNTTNVDATDSSNFGPAPVSSTLRSVASKSNSMMFKARDPSGLAPVSESKSSKGGVESWSVDDVAQWLESFDYGSYIEMFAKHNIDGAKLIKYGQNDFAELGVGSLLHQVKLEREVKKVIKSGGVIIT